MNSLVEIKFISPSKGRGIFAKKLIKKGKVIDVSPIILISNKDYDLIEQTVLYNYTYEWEDPKNGPEFKCAIALSFCQFINHSYKPNVKYFYDYDNNTITFIARRDIPKGDELTVNYNGLTKDKSPVWFEVE